MGYRIPDRGGIPFISLQNAIQADFATDGNRLPPGHNLAAQH